MAYRIASHALARLRDGLAGDFSRWADNGYSQSLDATGRHEGILFVHRHHEGVIWAWLRDGWQWEIVDGRQMEPSIMVTDIIDKGDGMALAAIVGGVVCATIPIIVEGQE